MVRFLIAALFLVGLALPLYAEETKVRFDGHRVKAIKEKLKAKWAKVKPKTPDVKPVEPKPAVKPGGKDLSYEALRKEGWHVDGPPQLLRGQFVDSNGNVIEDRVIPSVPSPRDKDGNALPPLPPNGRWIIDGPRKLAPAEVAEMLKNPPPRPPQEFHRGGHRFGHFHPLQRFRNRFHPSHRPDYTPGPSSPP